MQPSSPSRRGQNIWDKIWKNERGEVVVWQMPNAWLIGWAALTTLSLFVNGRLADVLEWAGLASLFVWSILEIVKGDSYFRRALGAVVFLMALLSLIKSF